MATRSHDDPSLTARARAGLAHGLDAIAGHTEAPLRVLGHADGRGHEVFDLQEEFELGPRGRRYLLSVDLSSREAMLLMMGGGPR
jgi:hypothetical protein